MKILELLVDEFVEILEVVSCFALNLAGSFWQEQSKHDRTESVSRKEIIAVKSNLT